MDDRLRGTLGRITAEEKLIRGTRNRLLAKNTGRARKGRMALAASFAALLLLGGLSLGVYFAPSAFIDIDINPGVELTLNRFDKVVKADAYNDDGALVLGAANILGASYDDAVERLLAAIAEQGYWTEEGLLSITVQADNINRESDMLAAVRSAVDASLPSQESGAQADVFPVTKEVKRHAHAHRLHPAKYLAISELIEVDPTTNFSECAQHSIREIKQMTTEHQKNCHANENDNTSGHCGCCR